MTGDEEIAEGEFPADWELDEVFARLKAALASLPEVDDVHRSTAPATVFDGARWVHDWVNLDAELAQLTRDSSTEDRLASVRSATSLRQIAFATQNYNIDIEIEPAERGVMMTGTVSPPTDGNVQAVVGGITHHGSIDGSGTFLIDNVNHGVVMAFITLESGTIRLGSFEV